MLHLPSLFLSQLITVQLIASTPAIAEEPPFVIEPSKKLPTKELPSPLRLDGTSPVLEEQRQKKEEEEKNNANKVPENSGKSGGGNQIMLGANTGGQTTFPSINGLSNICPNVKPDIDLKELINLVGTIFEKNFILTDDIKGSGTIICTKPLTRGELYEVFLSILEINGYTTVESSDRNYVKIVQVSGATNAPLSLGYEGDIGNTERYVTQIIQLDNVSVTDISPIVKDLSGKSAKIITYAPTNTLIITDASINIKRVYKIIKQMDVASPKSKLKIIPLHHATASDVQQIIDELYGSSSSGTSANKSGAGASKTTRTNRKGAASKTEATSGDATNVGSEGKYIEKIISDERTNSLIVMANEEALDTITKLIQDLDVDVDPASRAQIHVVYLEHAKAEDIAQVLSNLSNGGGSTNKNNTRNNNTRNNTTNNRNASTASKSTDTGSDSASAVAAFDSGIRITHDENTNSLVIIATPDQIQYVKQVIEKLDIRRKQVFVEAVVLELASDENFEFGLGAHLGKPNDDGSLSIFSSQLNGSSFGLSSDLLSGMAMGVFGEPVSVAVGDGFGGSANVSVPAFGIALNALQSNSSVNILSTPNILTLDNEEAAIIVGRNIPFPVSTGRDSNNNPIVSYQREDVAITLKVTPQINESNYVTLTVFQEVQEVESDSKGLDVSTAGFITSKRSADTTVLIKDNQTVVIGGLIGTTESTVATKIPLLGDIPIIGKLFRGKKTTARKTNMLIFLTPHVIDDESDLEEVYRIKVAQRQEFIRRFYGKSRNEQEVELAKLLQYSMNQIDKPSVYRGNQQIQTNWEVIGSQAPVANPLPESTQETEDTEEDIDDPNLEEKEDATEDVDSPAE